MENSIPKGFKMIFTPYITRKGKRIYKRNGGLFVFMVEDK
jgi:hypothetical protein